MVRDKRRGKDKEEESYLQVTKPHLWLKNKVNSRPEGPVTAENKQQ
jgi:hypothetical protein